MEKEILVVLKYLNHFRSFVLNTNVKIFTDNANLIPDTNLSTRCQRWKLELQEFDYTLYHIKGANNIGADTLSIIIYSVAEHNTGFPYNLEEISKKDFFFSYSNSKLKGYSQY